MGLLVKQVTDLANATIYMLAASVAAKLFQNLIKIRGYFYVEFQKCLERYQNKIWCAYSRDDDVLRILVVVVSSLLLKL